ncbi:MAG: tetratricopeptide repeat protein [Thermanaerothrix sp.]|uniref:Tetratricopeptide repeat protein n=1 Tax=Thermanaerothrix solaris TaxID=3058434 RepID=A0ABU3NQ79_9CHLR|nr:tetratricopeptide repeat protein [Thermanaerothrix sp. 4228-RoL]MDT8898994.1 tetratricopeptide repeat protein [Thermanaerothrix sp. 4228-RoL]
MMSPDYIVDVSEADFEYEVLAFSQNVPVVVDFWAAWCRPCRDLGALLVRLADEAQGRFRLARVNVDENPNLALRYGVRSLPTVKAFVNGQVVAEFVGAIPEPRLREFLERLQPPSPTALKLEKAESLLSEGEWAEAENLFREVLDDEGEDPRALLGLVKALLAQGKGYEGLAILEAFPPSRQYAQAMLLKPYAEALVELRQHRGIEDEGDELAAAYWNAIRLASRGNILAALDGLLDILRQDKRYREDQARQVVLSLLEILGEENPLTRQYRNELALILF